MNPQPEVRYLVTIHRAPGCYFAQVVGIPGCVARGSSEVEALENARIAIRAFVKAARLLSTEQPCVQLEITA